MEKHASAPRVRVSPGFWAMLALVWVLDDAGLVPALVLSAALHEAGHLAALRALGVRVLGLELGLRGAVLRAELTGRPREAWAVAAGPGVNLLLALALRGLRPGLCLCNLGLGLWNLLPVYPLDGGRLCRILLPRWFGPFGIRFCKLLDRGTRLGGLGLGLWASLGLGLGPLPALGAGFFLLRLPNGLAKTPEDW